MSYLLVKYNISKGSSWLDDIQKKGLGFNKVKHVKLFMKGQAF